MTLTHRRIIYSIFILIFFLFLPLIILYANGYRYNFKKDNFQKSGVIFLETKPKDVKIFLNDNLVDEKIPALIKNLTPNEYNLKVTKPDYADWEKKVKVSEGQTTSLQYVRLFKNKEIPKNIYQGEISSFKSSATGNILVFKKNEAEVNSLWWFNVNNQKILQIISSKNKIDNYQLIENGEYILVQLGDEYKLINPVKNTAIDLNQIIHLKQPINLKVNQYNSNYFYYGNSQGLYSYNLINNKQQLLLPYLPLDYKLENNNLYYLNQNSLNKIFLNKLDLSSGDITKNILSLNLSKGYEILDIKNELYTIKNNINNKLIIFNEQTNKSVIFDQAEYTKWDGEHAELIYGNSSELWVYKPYIEKDNHLLLTRTAKPLSTAEWYPIATHITYAVDGVIKIVENLATNRNISDILQATKISQLAVNKKGDKIYFIGQVGEVEGLFEVEIQ